MSRRSPLVLDFFHDVVCCWCFNLSSRLRRLAVEFELEVHHRTVVLQDSPQAMTERWGSPAQARQTILTHWAACRAASDEPERIRIEAMRGADFAYPHGLPAALACKAAERIGGPMAHWALFDRLQHAHLSEAKDVADATVLAAAARDAGIDGQAFATALADHATAQAVEADRVLAHQLGIRTIPALVVRRTGQRLDNGSLDHLRAQLAAQQGLDTAAAT